MTAHKILLVYEKATQGGSPRMLLEICRSLVESAEFEPTVALGRDGPIASQFENLAPTHVFRYPLPIPYTFRLQKKFRNHFRRLWLRRIIRQVKPCLIYHNTGNDVDLLVDLQLTGIPIIAHIHDLHHTSFLNGEQYIRTVANYATHYVACAETVRQRLIIGLGVPPESVSTVHNGLTWRSEKRTQAALEIREQLGLSENDILVLGAGRPTFAKGLDYFAGMAEQLAQAGFPAKIRCAWLGTQRHTRFENSVAQYAQQSGLPPLLLGFKQNIDDYFAAMDIFVLCSRFENLPLVVLQANAAGKPVVAFPVGGVPEILDAAGGILTDRFSAESLATAVLALASDAERRKVIGGEGAQRVRSHFSATTSMAQIHTLIRQQLSV